MLIFIFNALKYWYKKTRPLQKNPNIIQKSYNKWAAIMVYINRIPSSNKPKSTQKIITCLQ
ncbi:hypothetical protein LSO9J_240006 [Candidatus Liberibacter solanacearum]